MSKVRGATKRKCLHCKRPAHSRGVCHTHNEQIRSAIKAEKLTDAQAVKQGLWKAKAQRGPASGRELATKIARASIKKRRRAA